MDDHKPNIIDDLIALVGEKAVLQKTNDTKSYPEDSFNKKSNLHYLLFLPEGILV